MEYSAWRKKHLKRLAVKHGAYGSSVWCSAPSDKPLLVMVHGINGDHSGLVPLAVELVQEYRVAIVELPGHGKSGNVPLPSAAALQEWFDGVLYELEQKLGAAAAVCAHSFGCSAVLSGQTLGSRKVILLNPVPTPSDVYGTYARLIMNSARFWAHVYNWRLFVLLRTATLVKLRTRDAMRRVRWTSRQAHPSYRQIVYQAGLVDIILDSTAYRHAHGGAAALVVCGMFDTIAYQRDSLDMQGVFGGTKTVFLRGGHLLPIESPQRIARLISEAVVK